MRRFPPALATLVLAAACSGGGGGSGGGFLALEECPTARVPLPATETEMVLDLSGAGGFYDLAFPTDLRRDAGGLDLSGFPNPKGLALVDHMRTVAEEDIPAYSTAQAMYVRFTGPLDADRFSRDPAAYARPTAPVQVVDVDPASPERGRRFPLQVGFTTKADSFRPVNLLQVLVVEGFELRENNAYALLVTDGVCAPATTELRANGDLSDLLAGTNPGGALGVRALSAYAPLRARLAADRIDPARIVAATVFTTGSATERNFGVAERVAARPAPAPDGPLAFEREFPDYCVLKGSWSPPVFQEGTAPFFSDADGGSIRLDGAGDPVVQDVRAAPFYVTIPKARMPAAGFPMYQYLHGTGGTANQVWERGRRDAMGVREVGGGPARIAAERGWAAASMGGWMSVEHLGDLLSLGGYIAYNFFNPRALRDNFVQMAAEYILFRRLLENLALDASLCPGADASASADGKFRFDKTLWTIAGHSQGSYNAGMVTALDPKPFQGAVLSGAGGSWIQFALGPLDPPLTELLEAVLDLPEDEHLDIWHPISTLFEIAAGSANNIHYLPSIFRKPRPGRTPPHMIVIQGYKDLQTTTNLQRPVSVALGVDMVGPDVGPFPEGQILDAILLAGGRQLGYGAQNNFEVPGIGLRTVVTVRYEEDGILEGHSVPFQREEPKHQYGCFLADLARGRAPVIVEGVAEGGPCAP